MFGLIALAALSTAFEIGSTVMAAREKEKQLELQRKQAEILADQQAIARDNKMRRILGQQRVTAAAQGGTPGSFAAIERASFEAFAEDTRISDLNLMMKEESFDISEENVKQQAILKSLKTGVQFGAEAYGAHTGTLSSSDILSNILGKS